MSSLFFVQIRHLVRFGVSPDISTSTLKMGRKMSFDLLG